MASYHFELKMDKKPDGTKIDPVDHTQYVNREGKYTDVGLKKKDQAFNLITSKKASNIFFDEYANLYASPFGNIINTKNGVEVKGREQDISDQTLAIALLTAYSEMKNPLVIKGSRKFVDRIIKVAAEADLDIEFDSKAHQQKYLTLRKENYHGKESYGSHRRKRAGDAERIQKPSLAALGEHKVLASPQAQLSLHELPKCNLVHGRSGRDGISMFLRAHEEHGMDNFGERHDSDVRWSVYRGRRVKQYAKDTARLILEGLNKNKAKVLAVSNVEYINREEAFAKRGDLLYKGQQLPKWAKGDPKKFFAASDKYEGEIGCKYKEVEFSLPHELTLEQNLEIINEFIERHMKNHYYAFAIHDKEGSISGEKNHCHVHIMFSERIAVDLGKEKELSPKDFFSRKRNGAKKDEKWQKKKNPGFVSKLRRDCAEIQNAVLEKYGLMERVDHRSLKDIAEAAKANNDHVKAKLNDREAEKYIGVITDTENNPAVEALKRFRETIKSKKKIIFELELKKKELAESKLKSEIARSVEKIQELTLSDAYNENTDPDVEKLKGELRREIKVVTKLQSETKDAETAEREAVLGCIQSKDKKIWMEYSSIEREIKKLTDSDAPYEKLEALNQKLDELKKEAKPILDMLSTQEYQDKIQKYTYEILFENSFVRDKLRNELKKLDSIADLIHDRLFETSLAAEDKSIFTLKEISTGLWKQIYGYKKELKNINANIKKLKTRVLSPERAREMAKNIYLKGALKKERETLHNLKKMSPDHHDVRAMQNIKAQELVISNLLAKCDEPKAAAQIEKITKGILDKNLPIKKQYDRLLERKDIVTERINTLKSQMDTVNKYMKVVAPESKYQVTTPPPQLPKRYPSRESVVAAAMMKESAAMPHVIKIGEFQGMEKDWALMDVFEREEMQKRALRDL